jgi:AraC-like DNA-binding protein
MAEWSQSADEIFLPAAYSLLLLDTVRSWGVTEDDLLTPFGLEEREVSAPNARLPLRIVQEMIRKARYLTQEPGLGILVGLNTRANTYGFLSFAAMSASSLGEAVDLSIRYSSMLTTAFRFRLNAVDDFAGLIVDEQCGPSDCRDVLLLGLLVGIRMIGCALTGREPWRPIDVAMPEPAYYRRLAHLVPELRFDQPVNQVVLRQSDLELPLLTPNRAALRLATDQCEKGLRDLGADAGIEQATLQAMYREDETLPFVKVAAALRISPRTLRRRLAESGLTFSELTQKARSERALLLLRSSELSLEDVAERLGYSTLSNFVRAFRKWTGVTPAAYRKRVSARLPVHLPVRR